MYFAFDDRTARARQVRRQEIAFEVFEAVKRHALIPFSFLTVRPPLLTLESFRDHARVLDDLAPALVLCFYESCKCFR
jgi:hypothetical protein